MSHIVSFLVLVYPVLLLFPVFFGKNGFSITAPFFFGVFVAIFLSLLIKSKIIINNKNVLLALLLLILLSIFNFTSLRYSLPLFYLIYTLFLFLFFEDKNNSLDSKNVFFSNFLFIYILLAIPFIFLEQGYVKGDRFSGFIGSPTIFAGIISAVYIIFSNNKRLFSIKSILIYVIVLYIVYLTKTRLILLFLLIYPFLKVLMQYKKWFTIKRVFFIFLMTTLFIYFLYARVTEWFPSLVTLRYENARDSSFTLRFYLYSLVEDNFVNGSWSERIFGKGNEFSRNFIKAKFDRDLMPHNDYIRILSDWGAFGFLLFTYFFYKIGTKNKNTLFVSLIFMLLFYSNMIFNLFMISILIILYFDNEDNVDNQLKSN